MKRIGLWTLTLGLAAARPSLAADTLQVDRPGRRDRAALSLDSVERRKVTGRLVVDKNDFPAGITLSYRDLTARQVHVVPVGPLSEGRNTIPMVFPVPGRGELRIADAHSQRAFFVAVVVEPVVASPQRDFIYGPSGRAQVLLPAQVPPELRYLVFISPSTARLPEKGLIDEPVQIGCLSSEAGVSEALIGLTPLAVSSDRPVSLSVFDDLLGRWKALKSHTASTGTVFARGPIPGTYAVTEQP